MSDNGNGSGQVPLPMNDRGIFDRAVCLSLTVGCLGVRRKVPAASIQVDADKDLLHVSKAILESKELDTIKTLDGELRTWLAKRALPSPFRRGTYLIPLGLVEQVDAKLAEYQENRRDLVAQFLAVYDHSVEDAKKRLNGLFDVTDYPSDERLRAAFYVDVRYLAFGVPEKLEGIRRDIFEREKAKAETQWREASEEVRQALRAGLADLVDHMVERLQGNGDGKPKTFRDSLVGNMQEYLELFAPRNVTDDTQLAQLVGRCRNALDGVDADALRSSAAIRTKVREGMAQVQATLDTMVIDRPSRRIVLED
ncbi:MAG: hypothetical protein JXB32_14785 [Deltaproteobacteria bacterium]|nr:hypothetical protein [Deltaproteobacteria bacterium]